MDRSDILFKTNNILDGGELTHPEDIDFIMNMSNALDSFWLMMLTLERSESILSELGKTMREVFENQK